MKNNGFIYQFTYNYKGKYKRFVCYNEKDAITYFNILINCKCDSIRILTVSKRHFTY